MTLTDAITSGRRFQRDNTNNWFRWYYAKDKYVYYHQEPVGEVPESEGLASLTSIDDLTANNWVLEPEAKLLTWDEISDKIETNWNKLKNSNIGFEHALLELRMSIKEDLGFK